MKENLKISELKKIDEIFEKVISFLAYSTQKRNLAYKLQYHEFMVSIGNNYNLYGSVKGIYIQQLVILCSTICECLLFCYLRQNGFNSVARRRHKNVKFETLINSARSGSGNGPIISKSLSLRLKRLKKDRDLLHPEKQKDLVLKKFSIVVANSAASVVRSLIRELREHHLKNS